MIDICTKHNNTTFLREKLQTFRNMFQKESTPLLESVFKYLYKSTNKILEALEKEEGAEKISQLLSDDQTSQNDESKLQQAIFQNGDATPD